MRIVRRTTFLALGALLLLASPARALEGAVDLRNDEAMSVSVPLGSDNGVTAETDFRLALPDGSTVTTFPAEVFRDRFWTAPLPAGVYEAVPAGTPAASVTLPEEARRRLRENARRAGRDLAARRGAERREAMLRQAADLSERRERLLEEKERLAVRIADSAAGLAKDQDRLEWSDESVDRDIDRAEQAIADLSDRRDELAGQRDTLDRADREGHRRLTAEIERLNRRISSERDRLRSLRDRKRTDRASLRKDRADREGLIADRARLDAEIAQLDRQIRDLMKRARDPETPPR